MPRRREALASACWGGNPRRGRQPPHPPSVGPVGPTPLPSALGRMAGSGPSPLWRGPWPVCLGGPTPQCAFIADRLPPPQICPITHDLALPLSPLPGSALRLLVLRPGRSISGRSVAMDACLWCGGGRRLHHLVGLH